MPAMTLQPQRQALGAIQANRQAPVLQASAKPSAGMAKYVKAGFHMKGQQPAPEAPKQQPLQQSAPQQHPPQQQMPKVLPQKVAPVIIKQQQQMKAAHARTQMPVRRSAPPQEEKMMVIEVVRKPPMPDTVHAEAARGFMPVRKDATMQRPLAGSAPVQGQYSHYASTKSDISVGKTISVKETTFITGPMMAKTKSFQLEDVPAQVQIQPPTPLAPAHARNRAEDIKQANLVEQWLANQQPPAAPPAPRSENGDARSTRSADSRSGFECEVKNVGSTRSSRTYDQMPAPGSFMQGGPGEGPGLVC
jgi:hypothetical protein